MQQSRLSLSDIYDHWSRSLKPQLFRRIWGKHFEWESFPADDKLSFGGCILKRPHLGFKKHKERQRRGQISHAAVCPQPPEKTKFP